FFLAAAGGNPQIAKAAIRELIEAYNAATPIELDLVGRIIGFSTVAMDNLRLSMTPGLSDTKILRYRSNAATLSRSSDNARTMLEALQAGRAAKRDVPRPSVATAPRAPLQTRLPIKPAEQVSDMATDLEAMKRDARIMMAAFSKTGSVPPLNPPEMIRAAARDAVNSIQAASADPPRW
ncbi:MAG TPA: hypothetical protein VGC82_08240, partial [Rhodopila sp.]